jgi:hypothetical protein
LFKGERERRFCRDMKRRFAPVSFIGKYGRMISALQDYRPPSCLILSIARNASSGHPGADHAAVRILRRRLLFSRRGGSATEIARVGGDTINQVEFANAIRDQQDRMRQSAGKDYDPAMFNSPEMRFHCSSSSSDSEGA